MATLQRRKPIDRLTLLDLRTFPVWEFATEEESIAGRDETWVRPLKARTIPRDAASLSVAADFLAPKGVRFQGIVQVSTFRSVELGHAAIIAKRRYVFIPSADLWSAGKDAQSAARALGLSVPELFPLDYELNVVIRGERRCRVGRYAYALRPDGDGAAG